MLETGKEKSTKRSESKLKTEINAHTDTKHRIHSSPSVRRENCCVRRRRRERIRKCTCFFLSSSNSSILLFIFFASSTKLFLSLCLFRTYLNSMIFVQLHSYQTVLDYLLASSFLLLRLVKVLPAPELGLGVDVS